MYARAAGGVPGGRRSKAWRVTQPASRTPSWWVLYRLDPALNLHQPSLSKQHLNSLAHDHAMERGSTSPVSLVKDSSYARRAQYVYPMKLHSVRMPVGSIDFPAVRLLSTYERSCSEIQFAAAFTLSSSKFEPLRILNGIEPAPFLQVKQ